MDYLQLTAYLLVTVAGIGVVATRDPLPQAIAASVYGLLLTLLFLMLQAPDVALSELTIGATVYPLMIVTALAKTSGKGAE